MLGTNETKEEYNKSAESIAIYIFKGFVNVITNRKSQFSDKCPKVLLITPPIVDDTTEYARKRQYSTSKTKDVVSALKERAKVQGTYLLNSNDFIILGKDGVHFDKDSHKRLGEAICNFVKSTIFPTMPNLEANTNQFAL